MTRRIQAYKKMFPNLDVVGWYKAGLLGDAPDNQDLEIQAAIVEHCENPIFMIMNSQSVAAAQKNQIPVYIYETNQVTKKFESLDYTLAQSDDERIAVDHISKALDSDVK